VSKAVAIVDDALKTISELHEQIQAQRNELDKLRREIAVLRGMLNKRGSIHG